MNAMFKKVFIVLMSLLLMSGCTGKISRSDAQATTSAAINLAVSNQIATQDAQPTSTPQIVEVEKIVEIVKTVQVVVTATPEPAPTEAPIIWTQIQVGKFSELVPADGLQWELVRGTWFASTILNGYYEPKESALVGVVNGKDYGWCKPNQLDCPPHAYLILVEVPEQFVSCMKAPMDISWRIMPENNCGEPVPMRISLRENDKVRVSTDILEDYLALAGLTQQPLDTLSEVGLFVSVRENGQSELTYEGKKVAFGYSCWNCLPDTKGPNDPIPYPLVDVETFGVQGVGPTGSALLPGVVFALQRPTAEPQTLTFEVNVSAVPVVLWIGRYDNVPLPIPMPTATP